MPKYKVKGSQTRIKHSYVDEEGVRQEKVLREGDEVELNLQQAIQLRHNLEPLDEEGKFPEPTPSEGELEKFKEHEQDEILAKYEASLQQQLDAIKARRAELQEAAQKKSVEKATKAGAAKEAAPKPQETPGEKEKAKA